MVKREVKEWKAKQKGKCWKKAVGKLNQKHALAVVELENNLYILIYN